MQSMATFDKYTCYRIWHLIHPWVEMGHLWEPAVLKLCLHCYSATPFICAWFSHVPFSMVLYLKETWGQKLSILSLWGPNSDENSWDGFSGKLPVGKLLKYFLGRLTWKSTRRSCRPGHFIMSAPPLPLGSDNPMTAAFISIFQPLVFPWHIVTAEQIRSVSAVYKRDLNVTIANSTFWSRISVFAVAIRESAFILIREACFFQNRQMFGKVSNGLWPPPPVPLLSGKNVVDFWRHVDIDIFDLA